MPESILPVRARGGESDVSGRNRRETCDRQASDKARLWSRSRVLKKRKWATSTTAGVSVPSLLYLVVVRGTFFFSENSFGVMRGFDDRMKCSVRRRVRPGQPRCEYRARVFVADNSVRNQPGTQFDSRTEAIMAWFSVVVIPPPPPF